MRDEDGGSQIEDRGSKVEDRETTGARVGTPALDLPSSTVDPSPLRAWLYLVVLTIQRQARARQMVWMALALLAFTSTVIALNTAANRWNMGHQRATRGGLTYSQWLEQATLDVRIASATLDARAATAGAPMAAGISEAVVGSYRAALDNSGLLVFSRWIVYSVFVSFLLPVWSLSFATEALGGERESRSLVWLLTRPLPRPAIYAAKFVALLPWTLGFNVGGFAVLCLSAGAPGRLAFQLYWPAVAGASLAFCALFHLMSAVFRRPVIVAIVYSFFLEIILGTMPGYMKRISIGFYARCLMFDAAQGVGLQPPEKASVYLPVDAVTAWTVLAGTTVVMLVAGMIVFARSEYWQDI